MTRIFSAIALAAGAFVIIWFGSPFAFQLIALVMVIWGLLELTRIFFHDLFERVAVILAGGVTFLCGSASPQSLYLLLPVLLFFLALVLMWRNNTFEGVAGQLGIATFSLIYLGLTLIAWVKLRLLGPEWVLLILLPACLTDTFGLFVGKSVGKRPFAPHISPKKTWEGFWGAFVGSLLGTGTIWFLLFQEEFSFLHVIMLSLLVWITAPLGDLIESMLKRSAGVKDSGNIIPGHGGILDRADALVFSGPFAYLYLILFMGV